MQNTNNTIDIHEEISTEIAAEISMKANQYHHHYMSIIEVIQNAKQVVILPHKAVDGDGLCSSYALAIALKALGKDVSILIEEPEIPRTLSITEGDRFVKKSIATHPEVAIAMDSGDLERLGNRATLYTNATVKINIDHHVTNHIEADYKLVDTDAAATGEMIYHLLKKMNFPINAAIAQCLYVAITTDTGGFRFSNTTAQTHLIAAELLSTGINIAEISHRIFDITTFKKVRLTGEIIDNMILYGDQDIAFSHISNAFIQELNPSTDDYEGLVNIGRNIEGIEVSVVLKEIEPQLFKGSIRTNKEVDATAIAGHFEGGGHRRASGFTVRGEIVEARQRVIDKILEAFKKES